MTLEEIKKYLDVKIIYTPIIAVVVTTSYDGNECYLNTRYLIPDAFLEGEENFPNNFDFSKNCQEKVESVIQAPVGAFGVKAFYFYRGQDFGLDKELGIEWPNKRHEPIDWIENAWLLVEHSGLFRKRIEEYIEKKIQLEKKIQQEKTP